MPAIRRFLAQRHLTGLMLVAVLLLKLLVPTGYMIASDHGHVVLTLCPGVVPGTSMAMAMPGMHGHGKADQGKTELPCAFAGLSAQALGAVDPILLVALLVFIMGAALVPLVQPAPRARSFLRPPLRGPPAYR